MIVRVTKWMITPKHPKAVPVWSRDLLVGPPISQLIRGLDLSEYRVRDSLASEATVSAVRTQALIPASKQNGLLSTCVSPHHTRRFDVSVRRVNIQAARQDT